MSKQHPAGFPPSARQPLRGPRIALRIGLTGALILLLVLGRSLLSRGARYFAEMPDSRAVAVSGPALYAQHCAACHGTRGDGGGLAAQHLFPRPRDFRNERFRIVSTDRGTPAWEDLEAVTRRGLPGSPHPASSNLTPHEFADLVHYTRSLAQEPKRVLTNHQRALLAARRQNGKTDEPQDRSR